MKRFFIYILMGVTSLGIIGLGCALALYLWASKELPSISRVQDYRPALVTTVYARDGSTMGYFFREKRFLVNLDQLPVHVPQAFLAAEDATFYSHPGINYKAIARAFYTNLRSGGTTQGASTITQQVVKRLVLTPERTYKRKLQEALLAYQLEDRLEKDQILYIYLNQIYLGNSAYGVEAAARVYFGKHAQDLTVAEAAVLAALPKAPTSFNPYRNPESTRERQRWVLGQMQEKGFITKAQYDEALTQPLVYSSMPDPSWSVGSWYLEEVRRQLISYLSEDNVRSLGLALDLYGEDAVYEAGLHVHTAMDPVHQRAGEKALRYGLHTASQRRGWRGPLDHLQEGEYEAFLRANPFEPADLDDAGWVKALVTEVDKSGALVRLGGGYKGRIGVNTMSWARKINPNVAPERAGRTGDANRVLSPGDVVWVSAVGAHGDKNPVSAPASEDGKNSVPAYDAAKVDKDTPIPLALEQWPDLQGAVASIETETGDLVALVGGYDFSPQSQFNRATQARRQPGSSFKPIVYSAALDNGFTAGSVLLDTPFVLPASAGTKSWKPKNFDGKFLGPIVLRTALAKSRNVCTVRVAQTIGIDTVIERAHDLGITGDIPEVLAVSLGSYEVTPLGMAEAYTAFANNGIYIKPRIITSVSNIWNEEIVSFVPATHEAISPQNAYIMASLLKDVVNAGTAFRAKVLGRPVAGKTGTSNDERDGWFIGFSPYLVTSVYVGYDNNDPMGRMETGGRAALPVFIAYRQDVDEFYPPDDFPEPEGIVRLSVQGLSLPFMEGTGPGYASSSSDYYYYSYEGQEEVKNAEDLLKQLF